MKKVIAICALVLLPLLTQAAFPDNFWQLPPDQQIEILLIEGWGDYELNKIGKSAALPVLHSLLIKYINNYEKAKNIVGMISHFHDESSIDLLMQAWEKNHELENSIVAAISIIYSKNNNSDKAYQAMVTLIKAPRYQYDDYVGVNDRLFNTLVKRADKSRVPYLIDLLKNQNISGHEEIIKKLGEIGDPIVVVPVIADYLKNSSSVMRETASETLGNMGSSLAVQPLKDAVKNEKEIDVKLNMAAQLVKLGEFLYLEEMLKVLEDQKWGMFRDARGWAFEWLKELTGKDFKEDIVSWRNWFEEEKIKRGLK